MSVNAKPTRIYVYRDAGVGPFSYRELLGSLIDLVGNSYTVDPINATQIAAGDWVHDAALLAMPGGRDVPYCESLRGQANSHIRRYVESGGSYLGICAGGYYGSREVVFAKGEPLEVIGQRELGFYPGEAVGPLYPCTYDSEAGARPTLLGIGETNLHAYYNGGCYFNDPVRFDNDVSVIGRYVDNGGLAAMVSCQVGRGMAMLFGIHLEYRARFLTKLVLPEGMQASLEASETTRQTLFNQLVGYLVSRRACIGRE